MEYAPGDLVVVNGPAAVVVLPMAGAVDLPAIWAAVSEAQDFVEIAWLLFTRDTRASLVDVPDFLVAARHGDDARLMLRGCVQAEVAGPDTSPRLVRSTAVTTWHEEVLPGGARLVAARAGAELERPAQSRPLNSGLAAAGWISWTSHEHLHPRPRVADDEEVLLAIECLHGHLSPADTALCRSCGTPIPQQRPFHVHHPSLGRLRGPGMSDVAVVGPMVLGRWPTWGGRGEHPKLITLPDPDRSISRSHLAVRVSGWEVSVMDLDTENGTIVRLPTGESRELTPNVPVVIPPSTTVTLSGSVSLKFEQP